MNIAQILIIIQAELWHFGQEYKTGKHVPHNGSRKHHPQQTINHCALFKIVFFWYLFTITVPFSFMTYHRIFTGVTDEAGSAYLPECTFVFNGSRVAKYLFFSVRFCWPLFVFLSFFFWLLYILSILRIMASFDVLKMSSIINRCATLQGVVLSNGDNVRYSYSHRFPRRRRRRRRN